MTTNDVGNLSVSKIVTALIQAGYKVSMPFGDGCIYDIVVDDGEQLLKVQCKTGRLREGVIVASVRSNNGRWYASGGNRTYIGKVDKIAIYCPETDGIYLCPSDKKSSIYLRVDPAKNGMVTGIVWARDYKV